MSNFTLKLLAIIFMTIDHIGALGYNFMSRELITIFRMIGRLSFPIFLFLIIEGFNYTSNRKKYIKSLYLFGIISTIPFYIAFGTPFNVFFTLGSIVLMFHLFEKTNDPNEKRKIFLTILFSTILCDWALIAIPVAYYVSNNINDRNYLAKYIPLYLSFSYFILNSCFEIFIIKSNLYAIVRLSFLCLSILCTIPILLLYNGKIGLKLEGIKKYFFYFYYPLHLLVISIFLK